MLKIPLRRSLLKKRLMFLCLGSPATKYLAIKFFKKVLASLVRDRYLNIYIAKILPFLFAAVAANPLCNSRQAPSLQTATENRK